MTTRKRQDKYVTIKLRKDKGAKTNSTIRFKKGGKVYEGIVKEVKPNGSFKLM